MKGLRKFVRLSAQRRVLLLRVTVLLVGVRIALWVLSWRAVFRLLAKSLDAAAAPRPNAGSVSTSRVKVDDLVWAVHAVGRRVPGATCLTQALTLHVLLVRHGFPSRVHLGVGRAAEGAFCAHAWVEHEDRVVVGRREMPQYTPLLTFETPSPLSGATCTTS
jgi:hypothetical protein